jgi:hypothetical protein
MGNARSVRYRRLALAEEDKAKADLLLGSQMNAIGEFSAPLSGFFRTGYTAKMSSRQKRKTPRCGLSTTRTSDRGWKTSSPTGVARSARSEAAPSCVSQVRRSLGILLRTRPVHRWPSHERCPLPASRRSEQKPDRREERQGRPVRRGLIESVYLRYQPFDIALSFVGG